MAIYLRLSRSRLIVQVYAPIIAGEERRVKIPTHAKTCFFVSRAPGEFMAI